MSMSIYDFDTQFGPFEAFAPFAPYAPFALLALMSAPARWWTDAFLGAYGAWSEAMVGAMVYPFNLPSGTRSPAASKVEDEHPDTPRGRRTKRPEAGKTVTSA